ncbi:hypothetical protein HNP38_000104 [Chryseobacterium defluvii]|uniref:Tetratricopeptide repeat protein n=1 Tax=Chryseobacterium defluvii TaxID=160396 RepID=A0A840KCW4_9FLAO|nr:tetratricopeptide repeat protein [Chryseobacterium defluvii]MBB4804832.1 hypothetical protein [Chryseobacterium defluvii]
MYQKIYFLYLILFSFYCAFAQSLKNSASTMQTKAIDKKLEDIDVSFNSEISDTEKALFNLKSESEKIGYKWGILKSGRRIIEIYEKQNKNNEIIKLATELKKINAGPQADRIMANLYRSNALALGYLGFDEASLKDFKTAIIYAKKIDDPDIRNYTLALSYGQLTLYFFNKRLENKSYKDSVFNYQNKSIEAAKLIKDEHQEITAEIKYGLISFNYVRLAILYLEEADKPGNIKLAEKYLVEGLDIYKKYNLDNEDKVVLMNQLSWLYLEKKEYRKVIEYANQARDLEKKYPDPFNRVESFEFLASAYSALGDTENSKLYMDKYSYLKDSIRITEKNNADQSFNVLLSDSEKKQKKNH